MIRNIGTKDAPKIVRIDSGCVHNPRPRTAAGKAKHAARSEDRRKQVEKLWGSK